MTRCPLTVAGQSRPGLPGLRAWWPGTASLSNLKRFFSKAAPSPSLRFQDLSQPDPNYAKVCHHAIPLRNKVANWVCGSKQTILQVASLSVSALQERTQKKSRQGSKTSIWGKMEKMREKKNENGWKGLKESPFVSACSAVAFSCRITAPRVPSSFAWCGRNRRHNLSGLQVQLLQPLTRTSVFVQITL